MLSRRRDLKVELCLFVASTSETDSSKTFQFKDLLQLEMNPLSTTQTRNLERFGRVLFSLLPDDISPKETCISHDDCCHVHSDS